MWNRLLRNPRLLGAAVPSAAFFFAANNTSNSDDKKEAQTLVSSGFHVLPHPDKAARGGEDACFTSDHISCVGIADGVGGWASQGVDAGIYARQLMERCSAALQAVGGARTQPGATVKALHKAWQGVKVQGSCTACIAQFRSVSGEEVEVEVCNLGDSGFVAFRDGRVLCKSAAQQHSFNFPFQCGSTSGDNPKKADVYTFPVARGDVLVFGTDGIWDNLFDAEVAKLVLAKEADLGGLARAVTEAAHARGKDTRANTPFAIEARNAGYRFQGGKLDDTCVVAVRVLQGNRLEGEQEMRRTQFSKL